MLDIFVTCFSVFVGGRRPWWCGSFFRRSKAPQPFWWGPAAARRALHLHQETPLPILCCKRRPHTFVLQHTWDATETHLFVSGDKHFHELKRASWSRMNTFDAFFCWREDTSLDGMQQKHIVFLSGDKLFYELKRVYWSRMNAFDAFFLLKSIIWDSIVSSVWFVCPLCCTLLMSVIFLN